MSKTKPDRHQTAKDFHKVETDDDKAVRRWLEENYDRQAIPAKWQCGVSQRVKYEPKSGTQPVRFDPARYKTSRLAAISVAGLFCLFVIVALIIAM